MLNIREIATRVADEVTEITTQAEETVTSEDIFDITNAKLFIILAELQISDEDLSVVSDELSGLIAFYLNLPSEV